MDKRYYYRILGLREGASLSDIKTAYSKQIRKLKQPDYADDPEYVARKMDQARHAYSVLTGGAAPSTRSQKEARFEKWKDALDGGEDTIEDAKRAFEKHVRSCRPASGKKKRTYYSPDEAQRAETSEHSKKLVKIILIVVMFFSVFSSLITACIGIAGNVVYEVGDSLISEIGQGTVEQATQNIPEDEAVTAETAERIEQILANCHNYDYYGWLDLSGQNDFADQVEWDITQGDQSDIWGLMTDIAAYMGLYSNSEAITYVTGNPDFYWETDDLGNAQMLILIMNPPVYEEVAGGVNMYTGEVILDYSGYLRFLSDVAANQTEVAIGW